jgi:Anti-sigma-K factor rskA
VNEDEFAELLESGAPPQGRSRPGEEVRALLADESVWVEPDPAGADTLLRAIRRASASPWEIADDEFAAPLAPASGNSHGPVLTPVGASPSGRGAHAAPPGARRRPSRMPLLAAAAVLVLIAGVLGALVVLGGDEHHAPEFALGGTELAPGASAWATVDHQSAGVSIKLDVKGLAPAAPGTYYEAWVEGPEGKVSIGTFHMRGGDGWIYLWSGVDPAEYPTLNVTIEREGGELGWSGQIVLHGQIVA